jgi:NAD(P)-dependent dehydrogenase (short-subunit alcohol dehydrogenase family)
VQLGNRKIYGAGDGPPRTPGLCHDAQPGERRFIRADAGKPRITLEILQLDVTDQGSVTNAVQHVVKQAGALDVLANNAGMGSVGVVEDYTDEEIRYLFETNFFGAVRSAGAVLPVMRARWSGTIIMMSSISVLRTFPFSSV